MNHTNPRLERLHDPRVVELGQKLSLIQYASELLGP
jgi:hypothetical protein